jgi:hypothetical protein
MPFRLGRVDADTWRTQLALAPASIAVCRPRRGDQQTRERCGYATALARSGGLSGWALVDHVRRAVSR